MQWANASLFKLYFTIVISRTLKGSMTMQQRAKALKNFKSDPGTSVFLLSMKAGAVGINLTQANRVFLVEPALNPALEAQAIGRVHRLGQKRQVEIIRLIVDNSIETRILCRNRQPTVATSGQGNTCRLNEEDTMEDDLNSTSISEDSSMQFSLTEVSNYSASFSSTLGGQAIVGSLKNDKSLLKVEQFDELFGFKGSEGRWRC